MRNNKTSIYRGISKLTNNANKWEARVHLYSGRGKQVNKYIGCYSTEHEAYIARTKFLMDLV